MMIQENVRTYWAMTKTLETQWKKKVPSPLVTSHFLTSLYAAFISGGQQSQLKFVELFPRGDHGCYYTAIATGKHRPKPNVTI